MITYSKAVDYARRICYVREEAKELVHDLYLHLNRKGIDMFSVSKRFVWVAMNTLHYNQNYRSMAGRHKIDFVEVDEYYHRGSFSNPLEILIAKELSETFSPELSLKVEGYSNREIGKILGRTGQAIGHRIKLQKEGLCGAI